MDFLVEVVSHKINAWNGILIIVQVIVYLGFKCTFRAQIASIKITFRKHMNNREDPDPVRKGTGSSVMYTKYVYRENRNSLLCHSQHYIHCLIGQGVIIYGKACMDPKMPCHWKKTNSILRTVAVS